MIDTSPEGVPELLMSCQNGSSKLIAIAEEKLPVRSSACGKDTCLLWSPTAGDIVGKRGQHICHLSSLRMPVLENAQAALRKEARSAGGYIDKRWL